MHRIVMTGGLGDILSIEARFTPEERAGIEENLWACKPRRLVQPLFEAVAPWQHVRHSILWDSSDPSEGCYHGGELPSIGDLDVPEDAALWSVFHCFREVVQRPRIGSTFLQHPVASVDHLGLPPRYAVVQPSSPYNTASERAKRDYRPDDWGGTLAVLEAWDAIGVVIGGPGADPAPQSSLLIDLQGQTTFGESVEVLKAASGYVGIDSWASVLAAEVLPPEALLIRCDNTWPMCAREIYWPGVPSECLLRTFGNL